MLSSVTTTLKSFASSVPVVDCDVATPVVRRQGLVADLGDMAFEGPAGQGIDRDVRDLAHRDADDIGLIDLHLGRNDRHVGERHQGRALGVLDADNRGLALADRHVRHQRVVGSPANGLVE